MIRRSQGATLVEMLIGVSIVCILCALCTISFRAMIDRARQAQCVGNLRSIAAGTLAWVADNNGKLWSQTEVGNSTFRMVDDPLGVPYLLRDYVTSTKTWLCPAGRSNLRQFGNNYTWTSASFTDGTILKSSTPNRVVLFWDAYNYSLPSMYNASEPLGAGKFPTALSTKFHQHPHYGRTKSNWVFADGHVITGATAKQ